MVRMSTNPSIPTAPHYTHLNHHSPSNTLVQAQALSSGRTGATDSGSNAAKPALSKIPSGNVLLENYSNESFYTPAAARYVVLTDQRFPVVVAEVLPVRMFHGEIVKAKNYHLPDSVLAFKKHREARTALSAWTGGLIGLVLLGPVGAIIGASTAYTISKSVGKAKERALIRKAGLLPPSG
jgi:hypothetical protein